jgi:hypothetical protein
MQKLVGKPGALSDHILRCIAIKHCIQDAADVAILGVDFVESNHSCNDGSNTFSDNDMIASGGERGDAVSAHREHQQEEGGSPIDFVEFDNHGVDVDKEEDDNKVAAANNSIVGGIGKAHPGEAHPHPQSLLA